MRNLYFLLSVVSLVCLFCCTNSTTASQTNGPATDSVSKGSPIDGAWELVWVKYNDTVQNVSNRPMFKMFHDGVFSLMARDSAGKISFAGFGDYELSDNNVYKETFRYHTHAPYTGAMNWQNYELNGDTLYFKGFSKVIVGGQDLTKGWRRIEEKRVKVKF